MPRIINASKRVCTAVAAFIYDQEPRVKELRENFFEDRNEKLNLLEIKRSVIKTLPFAPQS